MDGIEVGAVDGPCGSQTQFAFGVYTEKLGGGQAHISGRDAEAAERGVPGDETTWPRQGLGVSGTPRE